MKILPEKLREANFRSYMLGKGCDDEITTFRGMQMFVVRSFSHLLLGGAGTSAPAARRTSRSTVGLTITWASSGCVIPSTLSIQINRCSKLCQDKLQTVSTRET